MKIIQIGVGGFGTSWRHALSTTKDIEIVALVDINRNALKEASEFFNIADDLCFINPDSSWTQISADVVIDSTPQLFHHINAMQAFASGKNLIVVKPMSDEWETGLMMVKSAGKYGKKMVVAQQLRFHPIIMKIREIIQSGILGKIGYVHLDAFFSKKGYSGSYPQPYPLLVQGSIHHFDYLRWVLDQEPLSVWANTWNPPWIKNNGAKCAYTCFEMALGTVVCYRSIATEMENVSNTSWLCNWFIEGENGILMTKNNQIYLNGNMINVSWEDGSDLGDLGLPKLNKIVLEIFTDYIQSGNEPGISGKNNLNSLEMVFGAIKSSQTGQKYYIGKYDIGG